MRLSVVLLALWFYAGSALAQERIASDLTPAQLAEAIRFGSEAKSLNAYKIQEKARFSWPPLIGSYTTPFLRVALAAHAAKKRYRPFSVSDVTADMIAPEIHVIAASQPVEGPAIANVETVVVMPVDSKDRGAAIHPTRTAELSEEYKNLFGFVAIGRGVLATFPIDVWRETNEVHVVFDREIPGSRGRGARGECTDCRSRIYLDKVR